MKIVDIKTFLMMAGAPESTGSSSWSARNWCFVKIYTDEGIVGIGEGSGWPRVVQTAIEDLRPIVLGEDPMNIERIWQKMLISTMGAGMTGTPGSGAINAMIAIGIFAIPTFARLTRANANAIWSREFILAARASGKRTARITVEHILPNIMSVIVVQATIEFALAILAEAALSYLGIGSQPPTPSWGRMLSEVQTLVFLNPWLAVYPGAAIALAVLGLNLLGDGLRDLLDPRLVRK